MKKLLLGALALSFIASSAIASAEIDDVDNTSLSPVVAQEVDNFDNFEMIEASSATGEEDKENTWGNWAYEKGKKVAKKGARRAAGTAAAKLSAPVAVAAGEAANALTFTAVTASTGNPLLGFAAGQMAGAAVKAGVPFVAYKVGYYSPEIAKGVGKAGKAVGKASEKIVVKGAEAIARGGINFYYGYQEQEGDLAEEIA